MNAVTANPNDLRVLVVDDALVIRGLISRHLRDVPGIVVVGSASDGQKAVERVAKGDIDVVILDIEMPNMDGIAALPHLLKIDPKLVVIMASTLTTRNADISLKALQLGASDYVPKPTTNSEIYGAEDFRRDLIEKIISFGRRRRKRSAAAVLANPAIPVARLRTPGRQRPQVLAVASSTGGPKALSAFFKNLPKDIGVPAVLTQHMPPTFTAMLAEHLTRDTGWTAQEARDGDTLAPGRVLVAPGDHHMLVVSDNGQLRVRLNQGEKENFCRPAADPMMRSLAIARLSTLAVVLTGMGHDGMAGCEAVLGTGGTVLAQDEESSVVWGMPGAVAQRGFCSVIATPEQLADAAGRFIKTGRLL
jgi:two-component system chemotaxis response regulator CheB